MYSIIRVMSPLESFTATMLSMAARRSATWGLIFTCTRSGLL